MARPVLFALSMLERSLAMGLSLVCAAACSNLADRQVIERASDDSSNGGSSGGHGGAPSSAGKAGSMVTEGGFPMALAGAGGGGGAPPTAGAAGVAGAPSQELPACSKQPSVMPLHALSVCEYERTVEKLTTTVVSAKLSNGSTGPGLFEAMALDAPTVSLLFDEVEHQRIVTQTPGTPLPCDASHGVDGLCVDQLIDTFVASAFRAPLSVPEKLRYMSLFKASTGNGDFAGATAMVLEAALLSPRFLLQGLPEPATSAAAERPLSQYELASRLSFALTGAPPDDTLSKMAEDGQLEGDGYAEQVKRLLYAPVYGDAALHFFSRWLGLDELELLVGPGVVPRLTPELVGSLRQETELFLGNAVIDNDSLVNLLQASSTFVDARLAPRYGVQPPASGFASVPVDPSRFSGILTQGSTLARFDNPARRGRFVQNRLLCTAVPDSPPGVDTNVVVAANQTHRDAWEAHLSATPACRACHSVMDPTGFAFEHFDEWGEYHETENGLPIDTHGSVLMDGAPVPLNGAVELGQTIASSAAWAECISRSVLGYVLERALEPSDDCTVKQLAQPFKDRHQQPLTVLLANIVQTHAFKYRDQVMVNDVPPPPLPNGSPTQSDVARKVFLLDFVIAETSWLSSEIPLENRPLFDQYLDSLRQLQQQLGNVVGGPGPQP